MFETKTLVQARRATVLDLLDRLLGKGVVAYGDVILSVADLDLVYLNLRAVLSAIGTLEKVEGGRSKVEGKQEKELGSSLDIGHEDGKWKVESGKWERQKNEEREIRNGKMDGTTGGPTNPPTREPANPQTREPANPQTPDFPKAVSHLENLVEDHKGRLKLDPEKTEQGLAKLVLTLMNLLRRLMERQAIRRMEAGTLTSQQMERAGLAFLRLDQKLKELAGQFGLKEEDLNLDLGPLGELV